MGRVGHGLGIMMYIACSTSATRRMSANCQDSLPQVARVDFGRSPSYRAWFDWVDRKEGIYRHRRNACNLTCCLQSHVLLATSRARSRLSLYQGPTHRTSGRLYIGHTTLVRWVAPAPSASFSLHAPLHAPEWSAILFLFPLFWRVAFLHAPVR